LPSSQDVKEIFIKAAGEYVKPDPHILYVVSDAKSIQPFIDSLVAEIKDRNYLELQRLTDNYVAVKNIYGSNTSITIKHTDGIIRGLRNHTGHRPTMLLGTGIGKTARELELMYQVWLPALHPVERTVNVYDEVL
jgi:hypothetical protein